MQKNSPFSYSRRNLLRCQSALFLSLVIEAIQFVTIKE
jgi:hypothetical protein